MKNILLLLTMAFIISCTSSEQKNGVDNKKDEIVQAPPPMNQAQIKELVQNTFKLEMFFHNNNFTSNVDGPQASIRVGSMIDEAGPKGDVNQCPENILISVLDVDMNLLTTLRISYNANCSIIDFHYEGEEGPRFRNKIASTGERTFQSLIDQSNKMMEQRRNG